MTEIKKYKMLINGNWTSGSENKFFFTKIEKITRKKNVFCLNYFEQNTFFLAC